MEKRIISVQCGILCAAVMAATGPICFAQYQRSSGGVQQVQPQGNALDASPQVGSGGSNNPITGYVPMNANNYVQGNASGLGGFGQQQSVVNVNGVNVPVTNWNTGTQSPYTSRADVGQNSSFSNWIRTTSGGLQTTPASAADSFYLPSSMVSTAQGNIYSSPYGSGFQNALVPQSAINPGAGVDTGMMTGGVSIRQFAATPTNQYGSYNSGLGSPLFAERNGNPAGNALGVDPGYNSMNQNNPSANPNLVDPAAIRGAPNGMPISGTGNALGDTDEERRAREKLGNPADLSSVARVDARVNGQAGSRLEGQPDSVQNANVLPQGQMIAERSKVNDTYKTLMGELEKAETDAAQKQALARANSNQPGKNGKGNQTANGSTTGPNGEQPASAPVSSRPNDNALSGTSGVDGKNMRNPFMQGQSNDPTKPGYRPESLRPMRIEDVPTTQLQAGKDVPAIKTFGSNGGATVTPFDELMGRAEGLLKEGKYLDAANAYQTAMLSQPDNLLVYMGRANAELGAGMYQSAAGDLKFVFTRKPELISVKYALEDFIPPQRQHQLLADLNGLSLGKGVGNTASFLLCYMDYNTGRDIELQRELGRWGARPWKDSWYDVMKRALGNGGEIGE